jgi:hypothetical protein
VFDGWAGLVSVVMGIGGFVVVVWGLDTGVDWEVESSFWIRLNLEVPPIIPRLFILWGPVG